MHGKRRKRSPFKTDGKEIKDDIRYMPGDSDWDSTIPRDVNIIKQHTRNRSVKEIKKTKDKNKDRLA